MGNLFVDKYINEIKEMMQSRSYTHAGKTSNIHNILRRCIKVLGTDVGIDENMFSWEENDAIEDAKILIDILQYHQIKDEHLKDEMGVVHQEQTTEPIIFISHKSDDKKYGHAIRNFLVGLGVKNNQLIYTSHELHKIPFGKNIFEYLRTNIHSNVFMIILWSDKYLESPACLNEMGAAWVVQSDYTNIYTPTFHFGNPKYRECAVDTNKMGAVLNGDGHCKTSMIELKDKVQALFGLDNDEKTTSYLLDQFMDEIRNDEEDSNIVIF